MLVAICDCHKNLTLVLELKSAYVGKVFYLFIFYGYAAVVHVLEHDETSANRCQITHCHTL